MHTPFLTRFLTAGLVATTVVSGFQFITGSGLVICNIAALMLAGPVLALPVENVVDLETREPHHAKAKAAKSKKVGRDDEMDDEMVAVLETREPHHAKAKAAKSKKVGRDDEMVADLETREPHHAKAKAAKSKKVGRGVN